MRLSETQAEVLKHIVKHGHGRIKVRTANGLIRLGLAERLTHTSSLIIPTDKGHDVARTL